MNSFVALLQSLALLLYLSGQIDPEQNYSGMWRPNVPVHLAHQGLNPGIAYTLLLQNMLLICVHIFLTGILASQDSKKEVKLSTYFSLILGRLNEVTGLPRGIKII